MRVLSPSAPQDAELSRCECGWPVCSDRADQPPTASPAYEVASSVPTRRAQQRGETEPDEERHTQFRGPVLLVRGLRVCRVGCSGGHLGLRQRGNRL